MGGFELIKRRILSHKRLQSTKFDRLIGVAETSVRCAPTALPSAIGAPPAGRDRTLIDELDRLAALAAPNWAYLEKMDTNLGGFVFV